MPIIITIPDGFKIGHWLSNERSYMTTSSFEKMLNLVIHDMMNGYRLFDMYPNIIIFGYNM